MADNVRLICWPTPDRLFIGVRLLNPDGEFVNNIETLAQIDTGYSGELLIPHSWYERLSLQDWAVTDAPFGQTVSGQSLDLLEAIGIVEIPQAKTEVTVIVQTFEGNTRLLIGRAFLRRHKLILDGPANQTCLMVST
jgi:predicted aspartyl protease